ncbi:hypothetical protein SAMN02745172_03667 [Pseudoxanthobacter soli DSM 19599]|uniref:Uncharacterized protein n=1 Tax=Pseudoxanthobacter soli DSM 19599 TaxID=1123029 RepID=A0A1M7ZQ38_9HYPH|nr:hypothetical protein SAMN02745172_03667 [Pseudoxanthobacter soli DSM 19599]
MEGRFTRRSLKHGKLGAMRAELRSEPNPVQTKPTEACDVTPAHLRSKTRNIAV